MNEQKDTQSPHSTIEKHKYPSCINVSKSSISIYLSFEFLIFEHMLKEQARWAPLSCGVGGSFVTLVAANTTFTGVNCEGCTTNKYVSTIKFFKKQVSKNQDFKVSSF